MKKICLFLLLSGVILLGCFGCGKKSAPINVEKTDLKSDFNGVYKNGDITLKVHAKTKNELIYFAETDEGSASGYLELNGSEAKYDFFDEVITFKMDGKNLIISNNRDILFDLSINLIQVYNDSDRMADIIIDFTHTFNDTMADFTNISFSKTKEIIEELSKLIKFKDKAAEILKNELFSNQESTLFFDSFFF